MLITIIILRTLRALSTGPFSPSGLLGAFCFAMMLRREHSFCRISVLTSLDQIRHLNVESQEGFSPYVCSAFKFKSNYFYKRVTPKCLIVSS